MWLLIFPCHFSPLYGDVTYLLMVHILHHYPHHYLLEPHQTFHFARSLRVLSCLLAFLCFHINDLEDFYLSLKIHFKFLLLLEMLPEFFRQSPAVLCLEISDSIHQGFLPDVSLLA